MNEPTWYWIVAGVTVLIFAAVPALFWLEDRAERRDREEWQRFMRRAR